MLIVNAHIENIRSIRELEWSIAPEQGPGWHVIIGDNGSGKSTVIRSIALALAGHDAWKALLHDVSAWIRSDSEYGQVSVRFAAEPPFDPPLGDDRSVQPPFSHVVLDPARQVWSGLVAERAPDRPRGWFSAAYGPFRRFAGGDVEHERRMSAHPIVARHISAFDERAALSESLAWLKDLKFKQLNGEAGGDALDPLVAFINQDGFLPHGARLTDISSTGVTFTDGDGFKVPVFELSDGYRSILSLTFDLIRHLVLACGTDGVFDAADPTHIIARGVVLVDEIDAHLHPSWQRQVGLWFRRHFPHMQFVVTTHSPLVCQAADVGTVFRLPRPGSGEAPRMVTGLELERLVYGNVLDAYGTELFGRGVTRSDASRQQVQRLAELNRKQRNGGLSSDERDELDRLRRRLPSEAYDVDVRG